MSELFHLCGCEAWATDEPSEIAVATVTWNGQLEASSGNLDPVKAVQEYWGTHLSAGRAIFSLRTVEKTVGGRVQNLKPWPKGVSGNPGGRPAKAPLTDVLANMLQSSCADDPEHRTYAEVIAEMLLKRACKGDLRAVREIADRVEGRPSQSLSVVTEECSTCRAAADEWRRELENMTDEQVRALAESIEPEAVSLR